MTSVVAETPLGALLPPRLQFGRFELQPRERRLLIDGEAATVGPRAFDLLLALVERQGQLVTKTELLDRVWPGLVVEENNLSVQVSSLRKLLGGDVIGTVPGRGYRFTAPTAGAPPAAAGMDATVGAASTASLTAPSASPAPSAPLAPASPAALRTNLPSLLTPLIGRDDDLAALHELVANHRLVTVVGAGGMGKTLLAQHLLTARTTRYTHGVCWVELGPLTDPSQIAPAIAAAVGVPLQGDDPEAALSKALAPLDLLLALDNAEHLLDAVALVVEALLQSAPGVRLIVTSQAPLKLPVERVMRLGTLSLPQGPLPAAEALAFGAVALFVERAQAVDSRFALTDANAPAVITLCRGLDGLALAIELAAARAPLLGVQKLADSLDARLKLLAGSRNRHAPQRQQTLRAALEWSHGLLAERERIVFRRLAVIVGSLDLQCVQRIASDEQLDEWAVLDALDILVDRSLVAVVQPEDWPAVRYRLLDSPKVFAMELLQQAGEVEAVRQRHAEALRDALLARDEDYDFDRVPVALFEAGAMLDEDDASEAARWAESNQLHDLVVDLLSSIIRATVSTTSGAPRAQSARLAQAVQSTTSLLHQARGCVVLSRSAQSLSRAATAAEQALLALRMLPESPQQQRCLWRAFLSLASGVQWTQPERARQLVSEMDALKVQAGPGRRRFARAEVMAVIGNDAERRDARRLLLELPRSEAGVARISLIDTALAQGDVETATLLGRDEVAYYSASRHVYNLAYARLNLAAALLVQDQTAEARPLLEAGWASTDRVDAFVPWFADYLALLAALDGRLADAARLLGFSDRAYADREDERLHNESTAFNRARDLATVALGAAEVERLMAEGARLRREDVGPLVFGAAT